MKYAHPSGLSLLCLFLLAACQTKMSPESSQYSKDSALLDSQLISIYEQTHENSALRITRLDSLAQQCGNKSQFYLQMKAYSLICNEYQFKKNVAALDSFSKKATIVTTLTQDSAVLASYHFILGKNLYATSRNQDTALSHLLKAAAFDKGSNTGTYVKSTLILGLIAQESGDYATALDFLDQAIYNKKKAGNDSLILAHYYMIAATLASSKVDTAATYSYYDSAQLIVNNAHLNKVRYQSFVEARLAMFEKRYSDALKAYNESESEYNLLRHTDKVKLFERIQKPDSVFKELAILDSLRTNVYSDKDILKEYLPLKIKYSPLSERGHYVDEYTTLMKKMLIENKAVVIQKNLQEIEGIQVEKANQIKISNEERRTTIAIFLAVLLGMAGLIAFLIIASKRKKLQLALLTSQYETSKQERNRIAQELHDDLGANFTSINMASGLLEIKQPGVRPKELEIILNNTQKVYTKLREIVWSMNAENDSLGNLILYIKRFADSFLDQAEIEMLFRDDTGTHHHLFIDALTRRRVYLACKEIINNSVKHSNASEIGLAFAIKGWQLQIIVSDNGIGFDTTQSYGGNGIVNVQKALGETSGSQIYVESNRFGTKYHINMLIKKI